MTDDNGAPTELDEAIETIDDRLVEGEFEAADQAVDEAIETFGDEEELLILRAEVALEAERYRECVLAVDDAVQRVDSDAANAQLLELRGYAQFYGDELDSARRSFNESIRTGGASWTALLGRAMVHEEMLYFRAAELDLDRAIAMDDQEAQPFAIRGSLHLRRGDLDEAEQDLAHALSLDPDDEESRLSLARLQAVARKTSAAIETLEPLVEQGRDPELVMPAALLRSQLSLTLGSVEVGTEDAESAIDAAPDAPWGYLQLAACRLTAMKPGDAIAAVKEAESRVDEARQIPDAFALRASAYNQLDKPEKAQKMRDRAEGAARLPDIVYGEWLNPARNVPINPNKPIDARTLMGQLFDDPAEAPAGYEKALQDVVDRIPELIEENPESDKIQIRLPDIEGAEEAPKNLVLQVNQQARKSTEGD